MPFLVDSNVLLDILTEDPNWFRWSASHLAECVEKDILVIWEAAFLAGKCFLAYKKRKGKKTSPLPDFYIGTHAAINNYILLTRDPKLYRTYFPKLKLITP